MAAVEGIGGVFFESSDPAALAGWYREHLGIEFMENPEDGGFFCVFLTRDLATSEIRQNPVFAINRAKAALAAADQRGFMVNLRVGDLSTTLDALRSSGASVEDETIEWEGGKHAWVRDLDGNRVELYEELTLAPDSQYRTD